MDGHKNVLENIDFTAMSLPERKVLIKMLNTQKGDIIRINRGECLKEIAEGSPPHSEATTLNLFCSHALRCIYCRGETNGAVYFNLFSEVTIVNDLIEIRVSDPDLVHEFCRQADNLFSEKEMVEYITLASRMGRILYVRAKQSKGKAFVVDVKEMSETLGLAGSTAAPLIQHHVLPALVDLREFFKDFWFSKQKREDGTELWFSAK